MTRRPDPLPADPLLPVRLQDGAVSIEGRPVLRHVDAMATGGRGVALIDQLATGWGVEEEPEDGKTVWFDVATDAEWQT